MSRSIMERTFKLTSDRVNSFIENYKKLEEISFYPIIGAKDLLSYNVQTEELKREITGLKDLKVSLPMFGQFYASLNDEDMRDVETNVFYSFNVYNIDVDISRLNNNLEEAENDLKGLNKLFWTGFIWSIAKNNFQWIGPFGFDIGESKISFKSKFAIPFTIENMIKYRDLIDKSVNELGVIYANNFFIKTEFIDKTLIAGEAHETHLFDNVYYKTYKKVPNSFDRNKLRTVLSMLYYASRAGDNNFEDFDEVVGNTIKEVESLIENNKRISFKFEGCEINIRKSTPTTIVFSNILANVINEINN